MNRGWSSTLLSPARQKSAGGRYRWGQTTSPRRPYRVTLLGATGVELGARSTIDFADEDPVNRRKRLEAVMLLAKTPLTTRKLAQLAHLADATEARTLVRRLNEIYEHHGRSLKIEQIAGGYRLMTRASVAPWLTRLGHLPPVMRLSSPMMETLAVVAYRQPVSRANVEAVRGVACGELLRQLMERDLIRIAGRSEELGRPYLYGTTKRFLQLFGLPSTDALPPINWQTLQEDPQSEDLTQQDLSTPMKESVVSTAFASVVTETDPEVVSPVYNPATQPGEDSQDICAVIEDEENEVYEEQADDEELDDEFDDEYDDEDGEWDEDEDDDEDWDEDDEDDLDDDDDEEEDDLDGEDEWEEVDDDDDDIDEEDDEDGDEGDEGDDEGDEEDWDEEDEEDWDEEEEEDEEDWE